MKNKIIILVLLVAAGMAGNAFADPTNESRYPVASNGANAVYFGHSYSK